MPRPLRILIAEDNPADAQLLVRALHKVGFEFEHRRVDTEADYLDHLRPDLDIILSDYEMPQFGGLRALELLQERGLDIPFILISGTIGEDLAVAAMKQGASDYLLKDRLARLGPAVTQAIDQARMRRERRKAAEALRESEERFREVVQNIEEVFWMTNLEKTKMLFVSAAYEKIWGRTCESLYASPATWLEAIHPEDRDRVSASASTNQVDGTYHEEYRIVRPNGSIRWINDHAFPVRNADGVVHRVAGVARDVTKRKQAEAALRLFRALVDQSADTFEVIDPATGRFLDVNEKGPTELGCTREEYLALRVCDIDPTVTPSIWRQIAENIRTAGFSSGDGFHRRKDGTMFPIEFNAKWVQLDRGYIVAVIRDITGRKQAEDILRESERRFREMLENVELIAMTLDKTGVITFCNDYLLRLTGWTRNELIGASWFTMFIPGNPEVAQIFMDNIEAGMIPAHHENPIKTKSGELRDIVWNNTLLRDTAGNITGTASVAEDVTERKRAEERIREQAALLDQAHEAIIVRDLPIGQVTFWNRGAERLYGWSAAEAVGRDMTQVLYIDQDAPRAIFEQLLQTGTWQGEKQQVTKTGRKLIVSSSATLVRDAKGNPKSVLVINIDITEQKNLEAQFLRAQRMESVGTLASGVAHDLNNILSPIMMSAAVLRQDLPPDIRKELIATIETSAERGAQIVKQVLTFGRGLEAEKRLLKIGPLIDEVTKIIRQTFPKDIVIETSLAPGLWPVNADATQMHQVLLNLCVNARDAMPDGGKLRLRASNLDLDASYASIASEATAGPHVLVEVSDTGTGIPPEVVERMFEPFFTTKGIGKGTGLGLSTVHGIVKNHGGFITVTSQPGQGTTFRVHLPASPEDDGRLACDAPHAAVPRGHGELVLVVDDEVGVRRAAQTALEAFGYGVLLATDGAEGLGVFAQNSSRVAILLVDLMMPIMGGVALIRALRTIARDVPIVASTGALESVQLTELKAMGVHTVLNKPYRADTMLRTIHTALHPESGD